MTTTVTAYDIPQPRTLDEVFGLLIPEGSTLTQHRLFDAMRALCQFPDPMFAGLTPRTPSFPVSIDTNGTLRVLGHRATWTEDEATTTVTQALGQGSAAEVRHFVAAYRTDAVDALDDSFLFAIAIIVWGGATQADDWMTWATHDPTGTNGKGLGYLCPAYWIARWGKDSLNALVAAGFTYAELSGVYQSEALPDPDAIATLIAMADSND